MVRWDVAKFVVIFLLAVAVWGGLGVGLVYAAMQNGWPFAVAVGLVYEGVSIYTGIVVSER